MPQVAVGEDEFVELDETGQPRRKTGKTRAARPQAPVRGKKAPARRRAPVKALVAGVAGDDAATDLDDLDEGAEVPVAVADATTTADATTADATTAEAAAPAAGADGTGSAA